MSDLLPLRHRSRPCLSCGRVSHLTVCAPCAQRAREEQARWSSCEDCGVPTSLPAYDGAIRCRRCRGLRHRAELARLFEAEADRDASLRGGASEALRKQMIAVDLRLECAKSMWWRREGR